MLLSPIPQPLKRAAVTAITLAALAISPAFADPGNGRGHGDGNGGGNAHSSANNHASVSDKDRDEPDGSSRRSKMDSNGLAAHSLGGLNGFLHASPMALMHASPKSRIGKIATVYAGQLQAFLANPKAANAPTLSQLHATLASAANKPLSASIIQAVDAKLASMNATLSTEISAYQGGASGLAQAIATAH